MKLELLKQADYTLNDCGRPIPPPGYRFVDLFRVIPFHFDTTATVGPATPFNRGITNNADTIFIARGVTIDASFSVRLRWPSGRFLSQSLMWYNALEASPMGTAGTMLALQSEEVIQPDGHVTIQISPGTGGNDQFVNLSLWGVLRYLLKDTDAIASGKTAGSAAPQSCIVGYEKGGNCIVGYPATAQLTGAAAAAAAALISDPVQALEARPRYVCTPNQNIMAPEYRLGNQCTPETPNGYRDEPYTFFSPAVTIPAGGEVDGLAVLVPGRETVVIRKITFYITLTGGGFFAVPTCQIRLPNGYSITGGDMIPCSSDFNFLPYVWQLPFFPTLHVAPGDRIILDFADMLVSGASEDSASTVFVEFDGVKRRKIQQ